MECGELDWSSGEGIWVLSILSKSKLSYLYNYSIPESMHKLNKRSRSVLTVDLIIEAVFNFFSRHPSSKYSNSESHETNCPKTGGDGGKTGRF